MPIGLIFRMSPKRVYILACKPVMESTSRPFQPTSNTLTINLGNYSATLFKRICQNWGHRNQQTLLSTSRPSPSVYIRPPASWPSKHQSAAEPFATPPSLEPRKLPSKKINVANLGWQSTTRSAHFLQHNRILSSDASFLFAFQNLIAALKKCGCSEMSIVMLLWDSAPYL